MTDPALIQPVICAAIILSALIVIPALRWAEQIETRKEGKG